MIRQSKTTAKQQPCGAPSYEGAPFFDPLAFLLDRGPLFWYNEEIYKLLSLVFLLFSVLSTLLIRALKEIQEYLELKILMNK